MFYFGQNLLTGKLLVNNHSNEILLTRLSKRLKAYLLFFFAFHVYIMKLKLISNNGKKSDVFAPNKSGLRFSK